MTLKIKQFLGKRRARIQLSGELRSEHLPMVRTEIGRSDPGVVLDLDEVDLVDIDAVRFLNACEAQGIEVVNCLPYIREWMSQERARENKSERR
jgi:anti-anti-sigma regulatory factor